MINSLFITQLKFIKFFIFYHNFLFFKTSSRNEQNTFRAEAKALLITTASFLKTRYDFEDDSFHKKKEFLYKKNPFDWEGFHKNLK